MVIKPGKQRCQDLRWKVHYSGIYRAQSFVLRAYAIHQLRNQHLIFLFYAAILFSLFSFVSRAMDFIVNKGEWL